MPRYKYQCSECGDVASVFHLMDETHSDCEACGVVDSMEKILTSPVVIQKEKADKQQVGALTQQYIEDNRRLLEIEKQKAMSEKYEPS